MTYMCISWNVYVRVMVIGIIGKLDHTIPYHTIPMLCLDHFCSTANKQSTLRILLTKCKKPVTPFSLTVVMSALLRALRQRERGGASVNGSRHSDLAAAAEAASLSGIAGE